MLNVLLHLLLFVFSLMIIWVLSGKLIEATDRVAKRYNKPGFAVAFFVLGFLTSISEFSVAFNSTLEGVPQISAGNLVGASIVIFLLIIPLLAVTCKKIELDHALRPSNLAFALVLIGLPVLFMLDGVVHRVDAWVTLALYATFIYRISKKQPLDETVQQAIGEVEVELVSKRRATVIDGVYIFIGALLIFFAGKMLVQESIYFTNLMGVPASIAGLIVLSLGTNVPELTIALRSAFSGTCDIAFGDYLGSAVANTFIFALIGIANPSFTVIRSEFALSSMILIPGLLLFWWFSRSKNDINRNEGIGLLALYVVFLVTQVINLF